MSPAADTAILISSCDRYSDLWRPFFTLFFRYWPVCPYPVYLQSNYRRWDDPRVRMVLVGEDRDWSTGFRMALDQVPERTIMVLMEDYLIEAPVDGDEVAELIGAMRKLGAGCLRLMPCPGPDSALDDHHGIGLISPGAPYRLSLQLAAWDKAMLTSLLVSGESAWDLEVKGSRRTDSVTAPFLAVKERQSGRYPIPYFVTGVVKGKWLPGALDLLKKEGISIDSSRPIQSMWDRIKLGRPGGWLVSLRDLARRVLRSLTVPL